MQDGKKAPGFSIKGAEDPGKYQIHKIKQIQLVAPTLN